jgi:hypothetical protein
MLKNRALREEDRSKIVDWVAADPDHCGKSDVGFWMPIPDDPSSLKFMVEDESGDLMAIRLEKVMRVHVQFAPATEKDRIRKALPDFLQFLDSEGRKHHYTQLIYESVYAPLIKFVQHFGWKSSVNEQIKNLS